MPVTRRQPIAPTADPTVNSARFAPAASNAPTAITTRGVKVSVRDSAALASAPTTNPTCTAIVIHAAVLGPRSQTSRSCGTTAEAENHVLMASRTATAS
jgi:hypothetical protein